MPAVLLAPDVRKGQTLTHAALQREAQKAIAEAVERGVKRYEVAAALEVTPPAITFALKNSGPKVAALQRRIIAHLTGYVVSEEPEYRVTDRVGQGGGDA